MQPQTDAQTWLNVIRKSKEAVNYKAAGEGNESCATCRFYVADMNGCTLVEGWIDPGGVSDFFEARPKMAMMTKTEKRGRDGKKNIAPEGVRAGDEVAARVSKYQSGHDGVAYADALRTVLKEDEALARVYRTGPGQTFYGDETDD